MLKKGGPYIEAFATPVKDLVLKFFSNYGEHLFDKDAELEPVFSVKNCVETVYTGGENLLMAIAASGFAGGGVKTAFYRLFGFLGAIAAYLLAKNIYQHVHTDPTTGRMSLDLWGALRTTTAELSLDLVKLVIALCLSRILKLGGTDVTKHADIPLVKPVKSAYEKWVNKSLSTRLATDPSRLFGGKQLALMARWNPDQIGVLVADFTGTLMGMPEKVGNQSLASSVANDLNRAMPNIPNGAAIDLGARDGWDANLRKLFGKGSTSYMDESGKTRVVEYWVWDSISGWISDLFNSPAVDSEFVEVLDEIVDGVLHGSEGVPYEKRFELIQHIGFIGATGDWYFLQDPQKEGDVDRSVFPDGAQRPFMDKGIDWHRYAM